MDVLAFLFTESQDDTEAANNQIEMIYVSLIAFHFFQKFNTDFAVYILLYTH